MNALNNMSSITNKSHDKIDVSIDGDARAPKPPWGGYLNYELVSLS